ncbi:hypothetical protein [Streptomyces otsuchiensis]|uniref:hypothetical protein n=1 Tax=Streptomyces otsuchiensis TaxID=2681388 RepID=UPI00102FCA87|nr:hypothetical protein [Streptomyces otsuchiensis]
MNHEAPLSSRSLRQLSDPWHRVMTLRELRAHGVPAEEAEERCAPGGPWQQPAPGVFLLHTGRPSGEELLLSAVRYAESCGRDTASPAGAAPGAAPAVSACATAGTAAAAERVLVTGMSALALYGFASAPRPALLERVDVLAPRRLRLASADRVRVRRCQTLPRAVRVDGFALAPVAWAVADAVAPPAGPETVRAVLVEAVAGGRCDAAAVVRELGRARLMSLPHVVGAVEAMVAAGRAAAEDRLMSLVAEGGLPDPCWNVRLRLPGGPQLATVDAYWPDHAVAVRLDTRTARRDLARERAERERQESLERMGVTVLTMTPQQVRTEPELRASLIRTALLAATTRPPAGYLMVLPG